MYSSNVTIRAPYPLKSCCAIAFQFAYNGGMARNLLTTQTTTPPTAIPVQVQYLEPLPPWLEREISQGIEHLPALRAALCRAQLKSKGVLNQTLRNDDQGYTYTSLAEVLGATREAMASEGLSLDQVTSDIEEEIQHTTKYGTRSLWKWRSVCLITHQDGASIVRIVRTITAVGEKAAGAARSGTDRTMIMTTMRVAGAKEEAPSREDAENNRSYRTGPRDAPTRERQAPSGNTQNTRNGSNTQNGRNGSNTQNGRNGSNTQNGGNGASSGQTTPPPTEAELKAAKGYVDELVTTLSTTTETARLTTWARLVLGRKLPFAEHERAVGAIKARAQALQMDPRPILIDAKKLGALTTEQVKIHDSGEWTDPAGLFL
jgi:hypothetical protein